MANRRDEAPKTWFRSNRVFRVDANWFIHTREAIAVGPYSDRFAADVDAEVLKSLLAGVEETTAEEVIRQFMADGGSNIVRSDATVIEFDADEVAGLLNDDDFEFDLDQVRQLS